MNHQFTTKRRCQSLEPSLRPTPSPSPSPPVSVSYSHAILINSKNGKNASLSPSRYFHFALITGAYACVYVRESRVSLQPNAPLSPLPLSLSLSHVMSNKREIERERESTTV